MSIMNLPKSSNTLLQTVRIDDKWSVVIDPLNNDKPLTVNRYGESVGDWKYDNFVTSMLFAFIDMETPAGQK